MRAAILISFWGFTAYAFVVRSGLLKLRTGDTGVRGVARDRGALALVAGLLLVPSWLATGLAPLLAPAPPWAPALVITAAGIVLGLVSQRVMGGSWRIGVAATDRTGLVTTGPFRWIRNPFFTGMALVATGTTLSALTVAGAVATLVLLATLAVQVRLVEEPHLSEVFGATYVEYTRRTGRFLPWLGRLS